jgi:hypothetical protein
MQWKLKMQQWAHWQTGKVWQTESKKKTIQTGRCMQGQRCRECHGVQDKRSKKTGGGERQRTRGKSQDACETPYMVNLLFSVWNRQPTWIGTSAVNNTSLYSTLVVQLECGSDSSTFTPLLEVAWESAAYSCSCAKTGTHKSIPV